MRTTYAKAKARSEKSRLIDEVVSLLGYHRKYAIQALNQERVRKVPVLRNKSTKYDDALPTIKMAWEALDYPCAERLHPVLASTAQLLAQHHELHLSQDVLDDLSRISRATLARRLSQWRLDKPRFTIPRRKPNSSLLREVPIGLYDWDEKRPGALEIDLVEHNGGSAHGHFAYTLSVVDIVTGYSRRRAVLGRGQAGVHRELRGIVGQWPCKPWGIHSDNGSEFLSDQLVRFCKQENLEFTRTRPWKKNDNAHVEQKNRQYVRETIGYDRYETAEAVEWLNQVYERLDVYANLFLPMRKLIFKQRNGPHVSKRYDTACTPFERLKSTGAVPEEACRQMERQRTALNPLALHRELEELLARGSALAQQPAVVCVPAG